MYFHMFLFNNKMVYDSGFFSGFILGAIPLTFTSSVAIVFLIACKQIVKFSLDLKSI